MSYLLRTQKTRIKPKNETMTNWRTTLGGALGNLGKALAGVGVLAQFTDAPPSSKYTLWYIALAGFLISCSAGFITSLFTADAKTVKEVAARTDVVVQQTNLNTVQIADTKAKVEETAFITKGTP